MYQGLAFGFSCLLTACATVNPRGGDSNSAPGIAVSVPSSVGGFQLLGSHPHDNPIVGTQWRYASTTHPELVSDVFVYVTGIFPDDVTAGADLMALMRLEFDVAVKRNLFSELEYLDERERSVRTRYDTTVGRHLRVAFERDGEEQISHAHLFYVPPYTVKFRSTFPSYGNASFDDQIDLLIDGFLSELSIDESIRCRKFTIHAGDAGAPSWVSKDGRDVLVGRGNTQEGVDELLAEASRRAKQYGCPLPIPFAH